MYGKIPFQRSANTLVALNMEVMRRTGGLTGKVASGGL
jgi:hypothetical protein